MVWKIWMGMLWTTLSLEERVSKPEWNLLRTEQVFERKDSEDTLET